MPILFVSHSRKDDAKGPWLEVNGFLARFRRVVWDNPTVQPLGGVLLTALFLLVAGLTHFYAHAQFREGGDTPFEQGVIPVEWGYATIVIVSLIALAMAFEPSLRRRRYLASPAEVEARGVLGRFWGGFAHLWSFIDFLFAEILARAAGATWSARWARYGQGAAWVLAAAAGGLAAPPPYGLALILFVLTLIIGVARRWYWIEADRARYMIERGKRGGAELAGFRNDLRDEALIGVVCLFLLAPLALSQIHNWTLAAGDPAFKIEGGHTLPEGAPAQWLAWLGFFGAELAKALPFVDWSEVFRIENASPIKAANAFGAQVVFFTRAALDLLLLAAVLQAVQVASQLRAQREAFDARELPVLEPFEEAIEFERVRRSAPEAIELATWEQPALDPIAHYDAKRLQQIVENQTGEMAAETRKLAAAALMRQSQDRNLEAGAPSVDAFFTRALAKEQDPESARWLSRIACLSEPDPATEELRAELPSILSATRRDWRVRAAAARALGRRTLPGDVVDQLTTIANTASALKLRADAALALAKGGAEPAGPALTALLDALGRGDLPLGDHRDAPREALITVAHGLALLGHEQGDVLGRIRTDEVARILAERGWRIQAAPMPHEAAKARDVGDALDQLVRLAPGEDPFPDRFMMGALEDEKEGVFYPAEREVRMAGPFAVGRYSVTFEEWRGFRLTFDLPEASFLGQSNISETEVLRWPSTEISWRDANAYCSWLSRITGERWRLLREAEWEYACRAGTPTVYAWGDHEPTPELANYQGARGRPIPVEGAGEDRSGAFCNAFGLWQMHGNAAEWCQDAWSEDAASNPEVSDSLPIKADTSLAVLRGGSWLYDPQFLRSAFRVGSDRDDRGNIVGFRLARTLGER